MRALVQPLSGGRLACRHGPIDLVVGADGSPEDVARTYAAVATFFPGILGGLVDELPLLRTRVGTVQPRGAIARCMHAAVWPYRAQFITPMAAVAGAVAQAVLDAMCEAAPRLTRAYVNNGGDIALHLAPGQAFTAGIVADIAAPAIDATVHIRHADAVRGIATSGWRGRSQSLGIADAVTVLAATPAQADAAATMIANAVDAEDAAIQRRPACEVRLDSDLGDLPVTVAVGSLDPGTRAAALAAGQKYAQDLVLNGRVVAAFIALQGATAVAGALPATRTAA